MIKRIVLVLAVVLAASGAEARHRHDGHRRVAHHHGWPRAAHGLSPAARRNVKRGLMLRDMAGRAPQKPAQADQRIAADLPPSPRFVGPSAAERRVAVRQAEDDYRAQKYAEQRALEKSLHDAWVRTHGETSESHRYDPRTPWAGSLRLPREDMR